MPPRRRGRACRSGCRPTRRPTSPPLPRSRRPPLVVAAAKICGSLDLIWRHNGQWVAVDIQNKIMLLAARRRSMAHASASDRCAADAAETARLRRRFPSTAATSASHARGGAPAAARRRRTGLLRPARPPRRGRAGRRRELHEAVPRCVTATRLQPAAMGRGLSQWTDRGSRGDAITWLHADTTTTFRGRCSPHAAARGIATGALRALDASRLMRPEAPRVSGGVSRSAS